MEQSLIKQNLLKIYSGNKLAAINNELIVSTFFPGEHPLDEIGVQKKIEELTLNEFYVKYKNQLEEFKKFIEWKLGRPDIVTPEQEVTTILYQVVLAKAIDFYKERDRYEYRMQNLFELLEAQFVTSKKWDQRLVNHFKFVFPILQEWYSFFLSYTNKKASDFNKRYIELLPSEFKAKAGTESNQIARFISDKLQQQFMPICFIDEKEIEYGENFQKKIDAAINKSQTFVQIISDISFQPIGENWCLYEYGGYSKFLKDLKEQNLHYYEEVFNNNFFFLVMGNDMKDVKPPIFLNEETESWFQKIEATHLKFFSTANDFNSFNESIRNLSLAIFATKKKLIEAIPA